MAQPTLTFNPVFAPMGVLAAAKLGGLEFTLAPDPKMGKDLPPSLTFPSG